MLLYDTAALLAGFLLDIWLGDPPQWPHLVRLYGTAAAWLEKRLYPMRNKRLAGFLLVACMLCIGAGIPSALLALAWRIHPWCYGAVSAILCWQCLAARSLQKESRQVYTALQGGTLQQARDAVGRIVGRDTQALDDQGVIRAAVETVAENTSDGEIAPLWYLMLFGAAGGCLYKTVNTMDSMFGYRNDRYRDFGFFAAKLDDVLNYLPSRLAALLMIGAAGMTGLDPSGAWRVWRRDRRKHASPNSAQTEAAAAGALGIRLAGDACYGGVRHRKEWIGDDLRPAAAEDILLAHRLLWGASGLMLGLVLLERVCCYVWL